jgi:hypothetical protein
MNYISNETLYNELQEVKGMLRQLLYRDVEHSIEEISLNKAAKQLHLSSRTVIQLVKDNRLKARVYRDNNKKLRYRFKVADIHEFQREDGYSEDNFDVGDIETTQDVIDRVMKRRK